jgi:hypothetical protein
MLFAMAMPSLARADDGRDDRNANGRQYDHSFVIVEENTEFSGIIGNAKAPTINRLASTSGLATKYFGAIHPSEGNYAAHTIKPSLVDQLEASR